VPHDTSDAGWPNKAALIDFGTFSISGAKCRSANGLPKNVAV
jgi:hypothetical protein